MLRICKAIENVVAYFVELKKGKAFILAYSIIRQPVLPYTLA
jgi:hypothetical protein